MDVYASMETTPDPVPDPELPRWCRDELDHRAKVRRRIDLALRAATSTALLSGSAVLFWTFVLDPPPTPAAPRGAPARPTADRTEPGPPVVVDYTPTEPSKPNPVLPALADGTATPSSGPIVIDAFPDDSVDPEDPVGLGDAQDALRHRPRPEKAARPKPPAPPKPRASTAPEPAPPRPRATPEQARPSAQPVRKPKKKKRRYLTADEECARTYKDPKLLLSCLKLWDSGARLAGSAETQDEPPLPRGLDRPRVIARSDVGDGLLRGDPVEDGQAGEREAGPSHAASAPDLDTTVAGAFEREAERGAGVRGVGGRAEVRAPHPAALPGGLGRSAEEVDPEIGLLPALLDATAQAPAADRQT
ncbi:hypothetical protein EDD29_8213 [Actinocorallia herbida]|uniref:Uncharacterized protein n=1 Tax=Actinocorallia herbida TaxID=58109 RepID=A0A3N1DAH6_9ACTN|nr:hypothetical protein EDD29_8213 [Actinocorallia herbida]